MLTEHECDVLVVGFGGSGAVAAISAHEAGAKVLVVEGSDDGGGGTRDSGGNIRSFLDPELAIKHYTLLTENVTSPEVVRACVEAAIELPEWISAHGGQVVASEPHGKARNQIYPASHDGSAFSEIEGADALGDRYRVVLGTWNSDKGPEPSGATLWQVLLAGVQKTKIPVLYSTKAQRLLQDPSSGRIVGALCQSSEGVIEVRANRGVILASGGFEDDSKMKLDYFGVDLPTLGAPGKRSGDGIRMAQAVGADLCHMGALAATFGYKFPEHDAAFYAVMRGPGFIIVDGDGRRYSNEAALDSHAAGLVALVPDAERTGYRRTPSYLVFDEETRYDGPIAKVKTGYNAGFDWSHDNSREVRSGWITSGESVAELARNLALPPTALDQTIGEFNRTCDTQSEDSHGRTLESMRSISSPPFYGIPIWPALFNTQGGPRRDEHGRVLNAFGEPIVGLYSAGEMGSMWSTFYPGAGNITEVLATGRIAGNAAASRST